MNLREQKYICTLAETNSLALAAKKLYISQAALSSFVSNLEKNMGHNLFDRIGKKFILTYIGEVYVKNARKMLEIEKHYELELNSITHGYKNHIKVGVQRIRTSYLSPWIIKTIYDKYPDTDAILYENSVSDLEDLLDNSQIELFFSNHTVTRKQFIYKTLYYDELMLIIHKDHPYMQTPPVDYIADINLLRDERFILQSQGHLLPYYRQIFNEALFVPKNIKYITGIFTVVGLVNMGYGVGFCCESYLRHAHTDFSNIRLLHINPETLRIPFSAVYQKNYTPPDYALDIINAVQNIMHSV